MKKLLVLALLALLAGFAVAEDLGIAVGSELYFGDVADKAVLEVAPLLKYGASVDALDIDLTLQYFIKFDDDTIQRFYAEPELTYTLPAGPGSLALALYGEFNFYIDPSDDYSGMLEPSFKYLQGFSFGDLFLKVGLPYTFEPDTSTDLYGTLGYGKGGFGLELTGKYNMDPDKKRTGYEALVSYGKDAFYGEVKVKSDKDFEVFTLSPYGELSADRLTLWAGVDFGNIGGDGDVTVEPYIGATWKF